MNSELNDNKRNMTKVTNDDPIKTLALKQPTIKRVKFADNQL